MQIMIDIPDDEYNEIIQGHKTFDTELCLLNGVINGTPLPKGHGRLVDYDHMKMNAEDYGLSAISLLSYLKPKVLIEADKDCEAE